MNKINEKIDKAAREYAEDAISHLYGKPTKAEFYDNPLYAFRKGAEYALSHQWQSVEDGLPKAKDYEYYLMPSMADDRPTIFVVSTFLLNVAYNDGSGHDYCEANFEILPDGEFRWSYNDDYIKARICTFKVTHWMPIPPLPDKRKEDANAN